MTPADPTLGKGARRTGEWLVHHGVCTPKQIEICLQAQNALKKYGGNNNYLPIGKIIEAHGFASREAIELAVRETGEVASDFRVNLPISVCREFRIMPIGIDGTALVVAPLEKLTAVELKDILRIAQSHGNPVESIRIEPRDAAEIRTSLQVSLRVDTQTLAQEIEKFCRLGMNRDGAVDDGGLLLDIITHLVVDAIQAEASDIRVHCSSNPLFNVIIYRIAGKLDHRFWLSPDAAIRLITKLKDKAGCVMSDKLRPQDGRLTISLGGTEQRELRFASAATDSGEEAVMRLFDLSVDATLSEVFRYQPSVRDELLQLSCIEGKSGGMVLFTGPTGAGKSTTMTAAIKEMPRHEINVETLEDPVENRIALVQQTSINETIGLTFAEGLRRLLRRDPDVIMIGELRDAETAEIALRTAETGHRMLTTLHTDTVPSSVSRLVNMLDPGYRSLGIIAIANTLRAVVNQRLIRRLCSCAEHVQAERLANDPLVASLLEIVGIEVSAELAVAKGCEWCDEGYIARRVQIAEAAFFPPSDALRQQMERMLRDGEPSRLVTLPGVRYYSRKAALRSLLLERVIDVREAIVALDLIGTVVPA